MEDVLGPAEFLRPERKRRRLPLVGVAVAVFIFWFVGRPLAAPLGWGEDFDSAIQQASAANKNLLIAFHSDSCPPCVAMERTVFRADVVQKAVSNFVPVRVDIRRKPEVAAMFGVTATPTYAILSPEGKLLAQRQGYQSEEEMLRFIQSAKSNPQSSP